MAYFLGHRYEGLNRNEEALAFWQTALKDGPADSVLRRLTAPELKRIGKGP